jgi:hypothetical protein
MYTPLHNFNSIPIINMLRLLRLSRGYQSPRGRVDDRAFEDVPVKRDLQPGDAPPSALTRIRKYPENYIPYDLNSSQGYLIYFLLLGLLGLDWYVDYQLKTITHRDKLTRSEMYPV